MNKEKRMYLQLFAEDPANPTEPTEPTEATEPATPPEDADGKKYTDEEVDSILAKKFAEWEKKQQKKVDEAKKLAEMNAQQKAEYERDTLQKKLDELSRKDTLSEMTKQARSMFVEKQINVSDEMLSMLVSDSADSTKVAVEGFISLFESSVEAAVKDALKGNSPTKKQVGNNITKEEILKVKNSAERQKLIAEHIDLFQ